MQKTNYLILGLLLALLSACATVAPPLDYPPEPNEPSGAGHRPPRKPAPPAPVDWPDEAPPNLQSIPDAVPRDEVIKSGPNRPYTIKGESYTPEINAKQFRQQGQASWYGKPFHGRQTATGEIYNMFTMTAAHRTLPIPSYARVTLLSTGKSVIVRVNDRGPFSKNRVIDLSYAAAFKLGFINLGTADVLVERVLPNEMEASR